MSTDLRISLFLPLDGREATRRKLPADTCLLRINALGHGDYSVMQTMAEVLWSQIRIDETCFAVAEGEFVSIRHVLTSTPGLDAQVAPTGIVTVSTSKALGELMVRWRAEELVICLITMPSRKMELEPGDLLRPGSGSTPSIGLKCSYASDHGSLEIAGPRGRVMAAFETTLIA